MAHVVLTRNLAHPALGKLKAWYESYLPRLIAPADIPSSEP